MSGEDVYEVFYLARGRDGNVFGGLVAIQFERFKSATGGGDARLCVLCGFSLRTLRLRAFLDFYDQLHKAFNR